MPGNFFDVESNWLSGLTSSGITGLTYPATTINTLTDANFSNALQNKVITNETARLDKKQQSIDLAKTSQNRMLTLNNSFSARYGAYTKIIIVLVVSFLIFIGLTFLHSAAPAIPGGIMDLAYILVLSVGFIYCLTIYMDIQSRDPVYFDQINVPAPPDNIVNNEGKSKDGNLIGGFGACVNDSCCATGTHWDTDTSTCLPDNCNAGKSWNTDNGNCDAFRGSISYEGFTSPFLNTMNALNPINMTVQPFQLSEGDLYSPVA